MWYEIIGLASIGVLWINSEPTIRLREWCYRKLYKCSGYNSKWHYRLLNCALCSTFWIALLWSGNIFIGASASVLAELLSQKLNQGTI